MEREGPRVLLALRDGTRAVTIDVHYRGAAALSVLLREASSGDDDEFSAECSIRGEIDERIPSTVPGSK